MIIKQIYLGFIRIHILHHAEEEPIYGQWMMEELQRHGYRIGPGTMYPILHELEQYKYLKSKKINVNGKIRRYYSITKKGEKTLLDAKSKINELVAEVLA